jgi:hypothetical protein
LEEYSIKECIKKAHQYKRSRSLDSFFLANGLFPFVAGIKRARKKVSRLDLRFD